MIGAALRHEFPLLAKHPEIHYLDNAATAQMPAAALAAVTQFETECRANAHRGVHRLAEAATDAYEAARASVADFLGAARDEIVFTSGTTASINLVAHSLGSTLKPGDEILISELEHHSNIVPWHQLRDRQGVVVKFAPATDDGRLDLSRLSDLVTTRCRLISLTHCSNVTGAQTDVSAVVAAARSVGAKILLDGAQRAPHGPLDLPRLGVDLYAFSGHKCFGPMGIGVLWGRRAVLENMPPFLGGGGTIREVTLERTEFAPPPGRFEAGTPPIDGAVGLGAALDWMGRQNWSQLAQHHLRLTGRVLDGLTAIRGVRVLGPLGLQERVGVVSFAVDGAHPHDVTQVLDDHGVACRGGHHCAQPLHRRFGVQGSARMSLAPYNDDDDVDALLRGLDAAVRILR